MPIIEPHTVTIEGHEPITVDGDIFFVEKNDKEEVYAVCVHNSRKRSSNYFPADCVVTTDAGTVYDFKGARVTDTRPEMFEKFISNANEHGVAERKDLEVKNGT